MSANEWLGWHFLPEDKRLRYGTREVVEVGKPIKVEGELKLCQWGLHASRRAIDALVYAPNSAKLYACRVRLGGELIESEDKAVASEREVLWMLDATKTLHLFACQIAEDTLSKYGNGDPRSAAAIQAKKDWLAGRITEQDLATAREAAEAAARSAAAAAGAAAGAARAGQNILVEKMLEEAHNDSLRA